MRIQHNIMAMSAYRNYTNNVSAMKKNLEKLSSGYKINRAGDDAAGLAISEKMRAQITGLETAQKNAKDGISLVQTAEGALTEVHDMLNRMVELATQSANGTYDNTTDRAQMQKEVNQLLEEIDRIADSSNFNGINLLDGTLGLNTDAFEVGASTGYTAAIDPKPVEVEFGSYHGGQAVSQVNPTFTIDLHDIQISNTSTTAASADVTFKVNVAGKDFTFVASDIAKGSDVGSTALTAALNAGIASGQNGFASVDGKTVVAIGGLNFEASVSGGKLTFTYAGVGTKTDANGSLIKASHASTFNALLGGDVTVTASTNAKIENQEGNYYCAIQAPTLAVAKETAQRPGIDIDIASLVKDGYKLTIASGTASTAGKTTYVFKTDKDSDVTAGAGETLIDVSMVASGDQAERAALIIAGGAHMTDGNPDGNANGAVQSAANGKFAVSVKSGTVIHLDAKATMAAANTEEKMQALITAQDAGADAVNANTKLKVTESALKEGNVLNIGGKKITVGKDETADTLAAKITAAGYKTTVADGTGADAGKKILTIEGLAKDADGNDIPAADRTAPMILGKGLTLQIGDTSDDFNQLNVAVQDMHAENLGVGKLDISTEEAAQQAIAKIKAAINTVSDVRGTLGATQNRLDHTINNLSVMTENIQDAESTIRDVDVAEEMMAYTKNNILIQSAQAMLAQANQVPQGVLQLLQ